MKNISYSIATLIFFILVSCSNDNKNKTSEIVQHVAINQSPLDGRKESGTLTSNRIEVGSEEIKPSLITKKKVNEKPQKSIQELTKEIVQIEEQGGINKEDAIIYYTYGEAMVDMEKYEEAIEMYQEAEKRGYEDLKTLYYKMARVYALEGDSYGSMEDYLISARKEGFRNYRALLYDAAFKDWRAGYDFMYLYNNLFKNNRKAMFKAFVTFAPKKKLVKDYVLNPKELFENTNYGHRSDIGYYKEGLAINGHFEDFAEGVSDGMFSRDGGDNYRYEFLLESKEQYFAVIYSIEEQWSEYILPKKYRLVTYDLKGNKISELDVAKRGSLKNCKAFVLHPDHSLTVTDYTIEWKKGAKSNLGGAEEYLYYKDLKDSKATVTKNYQITTKGRIVDKEGVALMGMR
jgi:tetratricopeptide (TPR) repeat protein